MVSTGVLVRVAILAVIGATLASLADVQVGVAIVDRAIELLDLTRYV